MAGRPLSQHTGVEELYRQRRELYAAFADHSVNNDGDPEAAVKEIVRLWESDF